MCVYVEIYVYCTVTFVTLVEIFYVKTSFRMTLKRPCAISVKTRHDASRRATLPTKAKDAVASRMFLQNSVVSGVP